MHANPIILTLNRDTASPPPSPPFPMEAKLPAGRERRRSVVRGILTLAIALLTGSGPRGHAEEGSDISPPAPATLKPQLPFTLPELPDDAPPSTNSHLPSATSQLPPASSQLPPSTAPVAEDIRDIRGPLKVPANAIRGWKLWAALGGLGALIAAWFYYRRRSSARPRLAYEIAFEQLQRARSLIQPEHAREFSIQVSAAVRTYLDQRFEVGATHCTTPEFLADLIARPNNPLHAHTGQLRDFLGHCDLAKFADFALTVPQMEAMHSSAWRLVDETRPRPEDQKTKPAVKQDRPSAVADAIPASAAGGAL